VKTISRITSIVLASSVFLSTIPKAQANPAVLAPVALCSTGVGCILVGAMAVGAITYYVWEYGGGKKVVADAAGRIFRYLDDPETDDVGVWEDPLDTANYPTASKICNDTAKRLGAQLVEIKRHPVTGKLSCIFRGGSGR
jgi:hypothetical protein